MTNRQIVEKYIKNGLLKKCLDYQFAKIKDKQFKEDLFQDMIVEMLGYDKLEQVEREGHMNAWITRYLQNNLYSRSSWYWRRYARFNIGTDEISEKEKNIPDGTIEI